MIDFIGAVVMVSGAAFALVAAIGVLRLPDLLMRMHASTKAGTLGAGLILVAVAIFYGDLGVTTRALATVAFLVLTAPVAAHMIGRAAYFDGVKLWEGTIVDDLQNRHEEVDEGEDRDDIRVANKRTPV